jgi:hypothetical protein
MACAWIMGCIGIVVTTTFPLRKLIPIVNLVSIVDEPWFFKCHHCLFLQACSP